MTRCKKGGLHMKKKFKAAVIMVICVVCICMDVKYMESVVWYADLRDAMKYAQEVAYQVGWTDHLVEVYNEAHAAIKRSEDPIVVAIRKHNCAMKFVTCIVICWIVATSFMLLLMCRFWQLEIIKLIKRWKKRHKK